jgi:hypothetical protein
MTKQHLLGLQEPPRMEALALCLLSMQNYGQHLGLTTMKLNGYEGSLKNAIAN